MEHIPTESQKRYTEQYPCPYFKDGREASVEYIVADSFSREAFHRFLLKGYRRLGRILYRNICSGCSACKPLRIEVEQFRPGKSDRRTLRENEDITVQIASRPSVSPEKIALYERYVRRKHGEPAIIPESGMAVVCSMHHGYDHIIEMNYFHGDILMGVGIIDEGEDCLSSNYFYYDTAYLKRRPGIFSILQEILLARNMGKRYHYLGFYIANNPSMAYKKDFHPNQILEDDVWTEFMH